MSKYPLVLTLDSTGNPNRWSTYKESILYQVTGLVAWSIG